MANKELDQMRSIISNLDSEATSKPQPSKTMNGGSAKIDGANPTSPSTNPATRREQYNNYIKTLDKDQASKLYQTVSNYKEMGLTDEQIYENVLSSAERNKNGIVEPAKTATTPNYTIDLKTKGNFDMYEPKIDETNADATFQKAISQLNDSVKGLGSLKLASENYQYTTGSTNVADINNLIKEIQKAYTAGVYDTSTIANQLGVDQEVIRKIQQGKASELVSIGEEFAQEQLKDFFRAEEDYDINLQRTMEDYNLAKTKLDAQFNSAMQTLKRSMFDEKRAASVGSAIADRSGSEYMIQRVEKGYQQNMDDLENNYLYSSLKQRASYIRAIQDYNTNIQRLGEDFDDAVKSIQLSVLQQFQEIDNKILTAEDNLKALSKLQGSTSTAMSDAVLKYIQGIEDANERQKAMQNFIASNYGYDVSDLTTQKFGESIRTGDTVGNDVNSIGHILNSDDGLRIGTYTNSKGYTYNVYATREDGLKATIQLLKRGYYGMTVADAAQKWIGQGKDISVAKSVMAKNGLKPTDKLSDANVEKFIQAMGQWEGTLKNGKTLDEWLKEGRTLGTSPTATATTTQGGTTTGGKAAGYDPAKAPLYESYLQGKYTNLKDYISDPTFQAESLAYQQSKTPTIISGIQDSLNTMVEFRNRYNELSAKEKEVISLIPAADIQDGGFRQNTTLTDKQKNVLNLYNQIKAQLFIDGIVDSKKKGASYGNLSDAEGNKISNAQTNLNVNTPSYVNYNVDKMIRDLVGDIEALGGTADTKSGYSYQPKKGKRLPTVVEASSLINSGASSEFNTTGGINLASTGSTNTGTFQIPFTNMK